MSGASRSSGAVGIDRPSRRHLVVAWSSREVRLDHRKVLRQDRPAVVRVVGVELLGPQQVSRHFGDERRNGRKRDRRRRRGRWVSDRGRRVEVGGRLAVRSLLAKASSCVVDASVAVVDGAVGRATVDGDESSSPLHAPSSARLSPHASRSRAGRTKDRAVTMSWVLPVPPTGPARASCPPPERAQGGSRLGAGDARTDRTPNRGASTRAPRRMRHWG